MKAGPRDREVTIQQLTDSDGTSGYPVESWTDLLPVEWMCKLAVTGSERFRAAQLSAAIDTRWQMNYREDMDPDAIDVPKKRRLLYQGRIFDITSAIEIGRQEGIELVTLAAAKVNEEVEA